MLAAKGSVVLTHFDHGVANILVAESREQMVRVLISTSLVAGWSSDRNLEALKKIASVLNQTILDIEYVRARGDGEDEGPDA